MVRRLSGAASDLATATTARRPHLRSGDGIPRLPACRVRVESGPDVADHRLLPRLGPIRLRHRRGARQRRRQRAAAPVRSRIEPAVAAGFIVLAPQNPDTTNSPARVRLWLNEVLPRYGVDRDRLYLTGLSQGGFGVFDYLGAYGDTNEFAAMVPIAGGFNRAIRCSDWQHTPLWAFHGEADQSVNVSGSINTVGFVNANCRAERTAAPHHVSGRRPQCMGPDLQLVGDGARAHQRHPRRLRHRHLHLDARSRAQPDEVTSFT